MAMKKFGDAQKTEVFTGKKAAVVRDHIVRTGKSLGDFSDDERKELDEALARLGDDGAPNRE